MGALTGYRVIELSGMGPGPMAGMLLADMGAEVIRVERSSLRDPLYVKDVSARGKKSIVLNIKHDEGRAALLKLVEGADVLIEGFRPGVVEKLGVGPDECLAVNKKLVYGRMTGWGQSGPLARAAGHDINYIALTGVLHACGEAGGKPIIPLNLVGDFGGGAMLLAMGVLAALLESKQSGRGQVVDAAMVDGAAQLMWMVHSFNASGQWNDEERGVNLLDGGAFFYDTYETQDNKYIALGSIEPQFFAELVERAELDTSRFNTETQYNVADWPAMKRDFQGIFKAKTRDQWCAILEGTDVCFAPVLSSSEAPEHPHNIARSTYIDVDGVVQPAPAPRFSRTASTVEYEQREPGVDGVDVMAECGFSPEEIAILKQNKVLG